MDETPNVARCYCPECEPNADPLKEILDVMWCEAHRPGTRGSEDVFVVSDTYVSGTGECGEDNQKWNDLIHRKKVFMRPQP